MNPKPTDTDRAQGATIGLFVILPVMTLGIFGGMVLTAVAGLSEMQFFGWVVFWMLGPLTGLNVLAWLRSGKWRDSSIPLRCRVGLHDTKRVEDFHHNPRYPVRRWECQREGCDYAPFMLKYRGQGLAPPTDSGSREST